MDGTCSAGEQVLYEDVSVEIILAKRPNGVWDLSISRGENLFYAEITNPNDDCMGTLIFNNNPPDCRGGSMDGTATVDVP